MKTPLRIGIAGAGPAGLAAAKALASGGHDVTVYEKHKGLSPWGAGVLIQPQGIRALRELGVLPEFEAASVPINRLLGVSHRGWRVVDIDYRGTHARSIGRAPLSRVLYQAAISAGAKVVFEAPVTMLRAVGTKAGVRIGERQELFDLFLIADGSNSQLRELVGLAGPARAYRWGALFGQFTVKDWYAPDTLMQRFRGTEEMMGLLPTELTNDGLALSFFWSLPHASYETWCSTSLDDWKEHVRSLWPEAEPVVRQIQRHDDLVVATYRHTWPKRLYSGPFAVLGDAAHAASPQLGLGTTLAVQDALAVAEGLREAKSVAEGLANYSCRRLRPSQIYQTLSRGLTPCFQAHGKGLWRDVLFAGGRYVPGVQYLMKRSIAAPE